jgi:hypothetical protein
VVVRMETMYHGSPYFSHWILKSSHCIYLPIYSSYFSHKIFGPEKLSTKLKGDQILM